jgi:hypothetical protein
MRERSMRTIIACLQVGHAARGRNKMSHNQQQQQQQQQQQNQEFSPT